jgi:hypothetical protein
MTLKRYGSVRSLLQAHASLSVGHNVNCGIRVQDKAGDLPCYGWGFLSEWTGEQRFVS